MRRFDLSTSAVKLQTALDDLQAHWHDATDQWRDEVSRKFAENHLEPIGPLVKNALDAVGRMAAVVAQAERDCGDQ